MDPVACSLSAIGENERARYTALVARFRASLTDCTELADGYRYRLNGTGFSLAEAEEWIAFERLCCPFLRFRMEVPGGEGDWLVTVTGPEGVKALLRGALMVD